MKEAIRKAEDRARKEALARGCAAREAAMHNVPVMKMEQVEFRDAHAWLATECRRDPINVDQDVASHGWTNWEVKKEPISKFVHLEPNHLFIDLDSPSPPQKKRKSTSELLVPASTTSSMPSRPVMNPTHLDLGLSAVEEEDDLEEALAREMDLLAEDSAFPNVGELGADQSCE